MLYLELYVVLKLGHFGKQIINALKVLKCGAVRGVVGERSPLSPSCYK
jgi:hypothetical protein